MKRLSAFFSAALVASLCAMPSLSQAQDRYGHDYYSYDYDQRECRAQEKDDKVAGAIIGGVLGAVAGSQLAGDGARTEGSALGAVAGVALGAGIADSNTNCDRRYGSRYSSYGDGYYENGQPYYGGQGDSYYRDGYGYQGGYGDTYHSGYPTYGYSTYGTHSSYYRPRPQISFSISNVQGYGHPRTRGHYRPRNYHGDHHRPRRTQRRRGHRHYHNGRACNIRH